MPRFLALHSTTVGKKAIMAVTGIVLVGFVVGHMIGNLKLYMPAHDGMAALDHYAEGLRLFGAPFLAEGQFLWLFRAIVLLAVGLHIWAAITLKLQSWKARPVGYRKVTHQESNAASRTMIWGGILLAAFIVFHIGHFTTGKVTPGFTFEHGAVFDNVTSGLSVLPIAIFYIVAMISLGMHLYHGVWSMLQTLGANNPRYNPLLRRIAIFIAMLVALGNISFPVAVLTGMVG
ncbi:succinate dehydrogenase [bacterium]|nr:MAG: succinate dehydrogenase [bacterium]